MQPAQRGCLDEPLIPLGRLRVIACGLVGDCAAPRCGGCIDNHPQSLQGFAIGNGLTDPAIQYGAYADFSLENGLIDEVDSRAGGRNFPLSPPLHFLCSTSLLQLVTLGWLLQDTYNNVQWYYPSCKSAIEVCNKQGWAAECRLAVTFCQVHVPS